MGPVSSRASVADRLRTFAAQQGEEQRKLTATEILLHLHQVAEILKTKGKQVTIIAVGGTVSVVFFNSREATEDIDFFYRTKQKNEDVSAVMAAAEAVAKKRGNNLEHGWLNNHASVFLAVSLAVIYERCLG